MEFLERAIMDKMAALGRRSVAKQYLKVGCLVSPSARKKKLGIYRNS